MGIRLCFDFAKSAVKRLDKLKKIMDHPSRAETIRQALTFYERKVYEDKKNDNEI